MSIYYVVKIFYEDPRESPLYLGVRRDGRSGGSTIGIVDVQGAKHFLWKEEAEVALREFMVDPNKGRITRGEVFFVKEERMGIVVKPGTPLQEVPSPEASTDDPEVDLDFDFEVGERIWRDYLKSEDGSKEEADLLHWAQEWFFDNADAIFAALHDRKARDAP